MGTWVPGTPGMEEARLDAWVAFLTGQLPALNTAIFSRTSEYYNQNMTPTSTSSNGLRWNGLQTITESMIMVGDSMTMFDLKSQPISIRITNGDELDGHDMESKLFYFAQSVGLDGNTGWQYTFYTHIYTYLHPELFANQNVPQQFADRERFMSRVVDWYAGIINYWNNVTHTGGTVLPLTSSVIGVPYDTIKEIQLRQVTKGILAKDSGGGVMYPVIKCMITGTQA